MADKQNKHKKNVAGSWYVDSSCVCCGQCCEIAVDNFEGDDVGMFIRKQPANPDEVAKCMEASNTCPLGAIWDDGEE